MTDSKKCARDDSGRQRAERDATAGKSREDLPFEGGLLDEFDVVDGLTADERREVDSGEPAPMSSGFGGPSFEDLNELRAELEAPDVVSPDVVSPDAASPAAASAVGSRSAPTQGRRTLMAAALLLAAVSIAAGPAVFRWLGRESTDTLGYERAIGVAIDATYDDGARVAALGRISTGILRVIIDAKERAEVDTQLGPTVDVLFAEIRRHCNAPTLATQGNAQPGFHADRLLAIREGAVQDAEVALLEIAPVLEHGIATLAALRNGNPQFARMHDRQIMYILERLSE